MDRLQQIDHDLRDLSDQLRLAEERGLYYLACDLAKDMDRLQDEQLEAIAEQDEC